MKPAGPLGEKMHDRFAERRGGREPVDYRNSPTTPNPKNRGYCVAGP